MTSPRSLFIALLLLALVAPALALSGGEADPNEAANAFMTGEHFDVNPIGVEYDPDDWLARLRAGAPTSGAS